MGWLAHAEVSWVSGGWLACPPLLQNGDSRGMGAQDKGWGSGRGGGTRVAL